MVRIRKQANETAKSLKMVEDRVLLAVIDFIFMTAA